MFLFSHCHKNFEPVDGWSLIDNKNFCNRRCEIGVCPECENDIIFLTETRISDGQVFPSVQIGKKALKIKKRCEKERINIDFTVPSGKLSGFVFGLNTERHNVYGKVTSLSQRACDWYNKTAKVRRIKVG